MSHKRAPWTVSQELAATYSRVLKWALQRVPFITHCSIALLGFVGPFLCPRLCAFVLVATHVVFVLCQSRTAYGIFRAWKGVRKSSTIDWAAEWTREAELLSKQRLSWDPLHFAAVQHCIILPAYKEDVSTLKETLDILASHPLASTNYNVCLGMEAREAGAVAKAQNLVDGYRYRGAFRDVCFSMHPGNIVGEAAGKSSNVNWAARFLAHRITEAHHPNSIITVMDADTAFAADFFLAAAVRFGLASPEERQRMMFVPPIVFDRNSHEVPVFTRTTDIFWSCAGIGGIYESSQCKIPTSAYAVSLQLAEYCGYWDGGPEAIGEDLHFYCKALFETKGNVKSVTVYSPASQYNVVGSPASGPIASYVSDMKARWTQACRHLWGSLDWGYCWHRTLTGSFGPSNQSTAAYMALRTDLDQAASPASTCVSDGDASLKPVDSDNPLLPLAFEPRVPSPSCSDSSTVYSSDVPELPRKVGRLDLPPYAPAPRHPSALVFDSEEAHLDDENSWDARNEAQSQALLEDRLVGDPSNLDDATPLRRWFRIVVLLTRLYEAHLMVAHLFLIMTALTLLPAVVYRNGTISITDPYARKCTWAICKHALEVTPFAATADLPSDLPPGLQPLWMLPDLILCSVRLARALGALGIVATILMCVIHDLYHSEACTLRWTRSDAALSAWKARGGAALPPGYLGMRAKQVSPRKWPSALLDYTAIPAGLLYGILPLLYAQLNHLVTNKMTYVVSAKGKNVVIPVTDEVIRQSIDLARRTSMSLGDRANSENITSRSSLTLARSRAGHSYHNNASVARISGEITRQQILTHPEDRRSRFQSFRSGSSEPLPTYEMQTR